MAPTACWLYLLLPADLLRCQSHKPLGWMIALTKRAIPLPAEDALQAEGVDVSGCGRAALPSGQGLVLLEGDGHATSVVVGGANTDFPQARAWRGRSGVGSRAHVLNGQHASPSGRHTMLGMPWARTTRQWDAQPGCKSLLCHPPGAAHCSSIGPPREGRWSCDAAAGSARARERGGGGCSGRRGRAGSPGEPPWMSLSPATVCQPTTMQSFKETMLFEPHWL